jgi:hypothetical protein
MTLAAGSNSRNSSSRFDPASTPRLVEPVLWPPGRLRLSTSPSCTGSLLTLKTIGIVVVAAFAATVEDVLLVTITATCRCTKSLAKSSSLPSRPSAQRYSTTTLRPST